MTNLPYEERVSQVCDAIQELLDADGDKAHLAAESAVYRLTHRPVTISERFILETLPVGTVVRDCRGVIYVRTEDNDTGLVWKGTNGSRASNGSLLFWDKGPVPVEVLWVTDDLQTPKEGK
jgi:hypothetical protein